MNKSDSALRMVSIEKANTRDGNESTEQAYI